MFLIPDKRIEFEATVAAPGPEAAARLFLQGIQDADPAILSALSTLVAWDHRGLVLQEKLSDAHRKPLLVSGPVRPHLPPEGSHDVRAIVTLSGTIESEDAQALAMDVLFVGSLVPDGRTVKTVEALRVKSPDGSEREFAFADVAASLSSDADGPAPR